MNLYIKNLWIIVYNLKKYIIDLLIWRQLWIRSKTKRALRVIKCKATITSKALCHQEIHRTCKKRRANMPTLQRHHKMLIRPTMLRAVGWACMIQRPTSATLEQIAITWVTMTAWFTRTPRDRALRRWGRGSRRRTLIRIEMPQVAAESSTNHRLQRHRISSVPIAQAFQ